MNSNLKVLISDPGFSNFSSFFKSQSNHDIVIHRNFDFNSLTYRIALFLKMSPLLIYLNSFYLIFKSKLYRADKIIIIKGSSINFDLLKRCDIIYKVYLWDSIKNLKNGLDFVNSPNNVFSFDIEDCKQYKFKYLPLFHFRGENPKFLKKNINNCRAKKISMYGSFSIDRVNFLKNNNSNNNFDYFLTISFFDFLKHIISKSISFKALWKYTTFKHLSRKKIEFFLNSYPFTLDISNKNQFGITTRTFEALSYSTSIISNNINTYKLYSEIGLKVVLINDNDNFDFSTLEFQTENNNILGYEKLNKYSIKNFLNNLI